MVARATLKWMGVALAVAVAAPALAADVTFVMRNDHPNAAAIASTIANEMESTSESY